MDDSDTINEWLWELPAAHVDHHKKHNSSADYTTATKLINQAGWGPQGFTDAIIDYQQTMWHAGVLSMEHEILQLLFAVA